MRREIILGEPYKIFYTFQRDVVINIATEFRLEKKVTRRKLRYTGSR